MVQDAAPLPSRRRFLKTGLVTGATVAYFGGADLLLRDSRWDENESCWLETAKRGTYPSLKGTASFDCAVIGGGLTGLSAAYHIHRADPEARIAVVEARYAGFGASGRNGGILCPMPESGQRLEEMGDLTDYTVRLIRNEGIDCELDSQRSHLNPYKLVIGLAACVARRGVKIYERSRVTAIDPTSSEVRGDGFSLKCGSVVIATNAYTSTLGVLERELLPVHTATIVTEPLDAAISRQLPGTFYLPLRGGSGYHWGRMLPDHRILFGTGMWYCYGNGLNFTRMGAVAPVLERAMKRRFPEVQGARVAFAWSGPVGAFPDLNPRIGPLRGYARTYFALGYAGSGVTMAIRSGHFVRALVAGEKVPEWCTRTSWRLPGEPVRYMGVNAVLRLMELGILS